MIYSNTPQQPTNVTTVQTQKDAAAAPFSAQSLEQDGGQQAVRELTLRKLIDGSIKDNESLNITTGVQIMDMRDNHLIADHNKDTEQFAASINRRLAGMSAICVLAPACTISPVRQPALS
jgi:predicted oxidoreductase